MAKKKYYKKKPQSFYKRFQIGFLKHESDISLVVIPIILFVILQIFNSLEISIEKNVEASRIITHNSELPVAPYLFLTDKITQPVTAEAAIIMDRDTKTMLYEKNSRVRFSMASTTKLMTALVATDYFNPEDILTAYTSQVEGVNVGIEVGQKFYFKDILFALLLPSGNDIALMISQNYPGGEKIFVEKMNQKAKDLHLVNTHFVDPAGLNDDGNYTTASELAELAVSVSKNQQISEVTATKSIIINTADGTSTFVLNNLNRLLGLYGVTGIKTGHTEGAGDVLITATTLHDHSYIVIVMRSQDRFADTEILLASLLNGVGVFAPKSFRD